MGCSNPHPHGQVWASNYLPNEARIKDENQMKYYQSHQRPLLLDYVNQELAKKVSHYTLFKVGTTKKWPNNFFLDNSITCRENI